MDLHKEGTTPPGTFQARTLLGLGPRPGPGPGPGLAGLVCGNKPVNNNDLDHLHQPNVFQCRNPFTKYDMSHPPPFAPLSNYVYGRLAGWLKWLLSCAMRWVTFQSICRYGVVRWRYFISTICALAQYHVPPYLNFHHQPLIAGSVSVDFSKIQWRTRGLFELRHASCLRHLRSTQVTRAI